MNRVVMVLASDIKQEVLQKNIMATAQKRNSYTGEHEMAKSRHWEKLPEGVYDDKTKSNENKKGNVIWIL